MAHPDLDALLNTLLPLAKELLAKQGEFFPFAAAMRADGQIVHVAAHDGDEHPASQQVIDNLVRALRPQAEGGAIRAAGICLDARVEPPGQSNKTDAVAMRLEHATGEAVQVFVPYRKTWLGKYKFDELFGTRGDRVIFDPAEGAA